MSRVQTHNSQQANVNDSTVFVQIDPDFTFDLFVENFFLNDPSWISKDVLNIEKNDCQHSTKTAVDEKNRP